MRSSSTSLRQRRPTRPSRNTASGSVTWSSSATPIRTESDAAAWLEGLINVEKRPDWPYRRLGLEPVRRLLSRLGDPQRGLRVLHVAGSKGKGSTVLLAESVLRAAGLATGAFTSPHLERWTERIRIDGREVAGARMAAAVERLRPHVEALQREDPHCAPSFFDATTAAALLLFRESRVDVALLEVGLGGRLDSTNVVEPAVTCITQIELEHTRWLGSTLAAIAGEKAGIIKPGVPLVAGDLPEAARAVVQARADELGAPAHWLGRDFSVQVLDSRADGLELDFRDGDLALRLRLPLLGEHHAVSAALALAGLRRLGALETRVLADAAGRGLAAVRLPARVELLRREPWIVIDAAHTPASARALARALALLGRRPTHLVLSISSDKDARALLKELLPLADSLCVTRAEPTRSLAPAEVAALARSVAPELPLSVVPNPHLALRAAAEGLAPDELLCVTGSVYLAGIARRVLGGALGPEPVSLCPPTP